MTIHTQRPLARLALAAALGLAMARPTLAQDTRKAEPLPKPQQAPSIDVPKLRYTEFKLPNGLRVILHEDHSSPIVAIETWYNAGAKDEPKGKTGLGHLFEHMMFGATVNLADGEYARTVQSAGGSYNARAENDWTRYYMSVPSNHLERGLWLEAERMANFAQAVDEKRFNLERDAVFNEYRDRILNDATQSAAEAMMEAVFLNGGIYSTPLFGYHADLRNETVADLRRFYETYYVPNNAVLVIAGDLSPAETRRMVEKHFAPVPRGKAPPKPPALTPLRGETRLAVEHPSGARQVWIGWRGAKSAAPDRPALMAAASIVGERLRRLLVTERRLAQAVPPGMNSNFDLRESGIVQLVANPTPTASATEIERLMDSVVTAVKTSGVTPAEVQRWVNSYRLQMLTAMQAVQTKAEFLADAAMNANDPMGIFGIVERAQRLTPADVQAAARKYMTADRVVLSVVPTGKLDLIARPDLPYVNASRKGGS